MPVAAAVSAAPVVRLAPMPLLPPLLPTTALVPAPAGADSPPARAAPEEAAHWARMDLHGERARGQTDRTVVAPVPAARSAAVKWPIHRAVAVALRANGFQGAAPAAEARDNPGSLRFRFALRRPPG